MPLNAGFLCFRMLHLPFRLMRTWRLRKTSTMDMLVFKQHHRNRAYFMLQHRYPSSVRLLILGRVESFSQCVEQVLVPINAPLMQNWSMHHCAELYFKRRETQSPPRRSSASGHGSCPGPGTDTSAKRRHRGKRVRKLA